MIDHIVLATPDLLGEVENFTALTGVRPVRGGSHVGLGTANFLVGLGGSAYLEIVGPDPEQPEPDRPRPFGIDGLVEPTIVTWAIRSQDIDATVARARARGYDPGEPGGMSRRTADGELLSWRLTPAATNPRDGVVPFVIDWGATTHPTRRGLPVVTLAEFRAEHPEPAAVASRLDALDAGLPVGLGPLPRLIAILDGGIVL